MRRVTNKSFLDNLISLIIPKAQQKQKDRESKQTHFFLYGMVGSIILLLYLILQPKVASQVVPLSQNNRFETFLSNSQQNGTIDPQTYWEFREFYSPGHFEFSRSGFSEEKIHSFLQSAEIPYMPTSQDQPFLLFSSPRLSSIDLLTPSPTIPALEKDVPGTTLWKTNTIQIIRTTNDKIVIIFTKPFEDMMEANGFFDYTNKDKDLDRSKYWLNITVVKPKE